MKPITSFFNLTKRSASSASLVTTSNQANKQVSNDSVSKDASLSNDDQKENIIGQNSFSNDNFKRAKDLDESTVVSISTPNIQDASTKDSLNKDFSKIEDLSNKDSSNKDPSNKDLSNKDISQNDEKAKLQQAKELQANRVQGAEGMSLEWKQILKNEFSKPYFKTVPKNHLNLTLE